MAGLEESTRIVQLKVRLLGLSPMIWRRVLVPESVSLRELHDILQVCMGWEGIHLRSRELVMFRLTMWLIQMDCSLGVRWLCSVEGDNRSSSTRRTLGVILNKVSPSQLMCAHSQIM